ncbi:MAG: dihydroorotase [Bdellovibrionaceae bacterium]|nr:dihydroorotase [Bdellovibrio sp.]
MENVDLILKNAEALIYDSQLKKIVKHKVDIAVKNQKIHEIATSITASATRELDLKGLTILPGVIDSQVHFREPGFTHKEDLESGTRAAVLGGVTSVFEMPNTNPTTTTVEAYEDKMARAKNRVHCHYAFFCGATSENINLLPELEKLPHSPGIKIFLGASFGSLLVDDDSVFEKVMKNGRKRLTIHSEDEARLVSRKHIAIEAAHPRVHAIWRDEESAMISTRKAVALAHKYNRPIHILHVSSSEEMEFLQLHKDIASVEILPQFLTLSAPECYERLGTLAQQNPPIRDIRHFDKLWQAVQNGTVDIIGSDHAPHTLEEKNKPYPQSPSGFPGVQTLMPIMLNHVHQGRFSLERLTEMVTEAPRRLFNIKNKGRIQVGYDADFTVVDLKRNNEIKNSWIASKCGYTPFDGMKVVGWPTHTILKGEVIMQNDELIKPSQGTAIDFEANA